MIIQSVDGKFYLNPKIESKLLSVYCDEDNLIVSYRGDPTWATVSRGLSKVGVMTRGHVMFGSLFQCVIINKKLQECVSYSLILRSPYPVPTSYDAALSSPEGYRWEKIIKFCGMK